MRLQDHMATSGTLLFRWRSYLPLVFVPFILLSVLEGPKIELAVGSALAWVWSLLCIAMVALGEIIRILTIAFVPSGTSGRNVEGQKADVLNTTGIYSVVRNPLYLGNCLMYVGIALFSQSLLLALVMALVLLPYYERIIAAEESYLSGKFGAAYDEWTAVTPVFIPVVAGWVKPSMRFSWKMVIRREHASIFGGILALYLIAVGLHWAGPRTTPMASVWHWLMAVAVVAEALALWLKLKTPFLDIHDR